MLGKMLIHGLVAAAVIGSAAAVYAQTKDNGYLSPTQPPAKVEPARAAPVGADGYIRPAAEQERKFHQSEVKGDAKAEHRRSGRERDHDDDDD